MDERLIALAKSSQTTPFGFADSVEKDYNWATAERVKWACELLPLMFEESRNRQASRSSYSLKHEVEDLFKEYAPELASVHGCYLSNGECIVAMAYCGFHSYNKSGPNAYYLLKDKRKGAKNKKGKAKALADETEAKINQLLRQKVAEHSRPKE